MDWPLVIDRNRTALLAIVAAIAALLGGREGGPVARRLRSAALASLRPAESACRRLIVIAARGLTVTLGPPRRPAFDLLTAAAATSSRTPTFPLFDRQKRFGRMLVVARPRGVPRIRTFWGAPMPLAAIIPSPPKGTRPDPDAPVDIARLGLRLRSLEAALADLPRQARRLARWRARWSASPGATAPDRRPRSPLRLGHPPGHRQRPQQEIDFVLRECHALALEARPRDTS
jgi:hypothetical protein